jgi:ABC-2 type transport system ATP-binding protein
MIEVKNLHKKYGNFVALKGVSFNIKKGEILALLGPNGAGKTTTMKIITGYLLALEGEIFYQDNKISDFNNFQKNIGYLPENAPLYQDLTVYEHLEFSASLHNIPQNKRAYSINEIAKICGLTEKINNEVSELSKGYKQRTALAQALIHNPEILILDEPTTGLDPNQILEIRDLIKKIAKDKYLVLSTHIMQEVERIADRVILMNKGEIVKEGSTEDLLKGNNENKFKILVTVEGKQSKVVDILKNIGGVKKVTKKENIKTGVNIYQVESESDLRKEITSSLIKADLDLYEIKSETLSLENIFYELTR